eukprot:scaffold5182_cov65-Cyclotella_meneghiniana.AAC.2
MALQSPAATQTVSRKLNLNLQYSSFENHSVELQVKMRTFCLMPPRSPIIDLTELTAKFGSTTTTTHFHPGYFRTIINLITAVLNRVSYLPKGRDNMILVNGFIG